LRPPTEATVLNMSPWRWQAMSQVSLRLAVASRAKIRRPVPGVVCVDDLVISAIKVSISAEIGADLFLAGSIFVILASLVHGLHGLHGSGPLPPVSLQRCEPYRGVPK